ncbi:guanine nucleotide binding protein, alpha subunit [Leucogyrophana mollusca]|uniref:Guanine nucleotide binding protein, alpha subunit n=1 Tax=Leucogyrophana mollusca TaxID=85980 RepID=A0ACB8B4X1_9AGAM|nr:guanine nucleotide binding protein, alpha subunit [Leucogyrophana mollusca]
MQVNAERILDYRVNETGEYVLTSEVARAIHEFWGDGIVPKILEHSNEFYLMDNAPYFFGEVLRIGAPLYQPTERDVLRTRRKTTGITETRFEIGHLSIHMFDVGGQRSERRKWIHCFESVTTIIFCTALNEYDQVLLEDKTQNRMVESLVLFESVINSRWFLRSSIILFLNKIDLFKVKIPKVPLSRYFPEYTGGPDMNKAAKYILWRFMTLNRAHLSIYPHLIQATDTSSVRQVFGTLKETLLQNALKDSYIL